MPSSEEKAGGVSAITDEMKKRQVRTSNACMGCRKKKIRCNGKQPCTACAMRGRDCVYTTLTVTGRPSKGSLKLLQRQIQQLELELAEAKKTMHDSRPTLAGPSFSSTSRLPHIIQDQQTRTSSDEEKDEDDFIFCNSDANRHSLINESFGKSFQRSVLDLHTSSRLENHAEHDYMSNQGLIAMCIRFTSNLRTEDAPKFNVKLSADNKRSLEVPSFREAQNRIYEAMNVPSSDIDLHWPSREREDQLISVYFRLVHPNFPILCKDTLTLQRSGQLRHVLRGDPVWVSIMLGVFIAAARHLPAESENIQRWWNVRVRLGVHQIAHTRSIGGVQDCLMTTLISRALMTSHHAEWTTTGIALRILQNRGFHREAVLQYVKRDERYVDLIRCLWWTAQMMDVNICCWVGHSPAMSKFDALPPRGSMLASPLTYFIAALKGLPMLVSALDKGYASSLSTRISAAQDVQNWHKELKEFFAFSADGKDDEKTFACAKLWMFANCTLLKVYRPSVSCMLRMAAIRMKTRRSKGDTQAEQQQESVMQETEKDCTHLYDEVSATFKEAMHMTAIILQSLVRRSEKGITFFDDMINTQTGLIVCFSCFMVFTEAVLGRDTTKMMQDIESACNSLEKFDYRTEAFTICKAYCRNIFVTIKMRLEHQKHSSSERSGNAARASKAGFKASTHEAERYPEQYASAWKEYDEASSALDVGIPPPMGPIFAKVEHTSPTASSARCTAASTSEGSSRGPCQHSQSTPSTDDGSPQLSGMFMTSSQYDRASPQSRLWENFVYNEMMFLDTYDQPMLIDPTSDAGTSSALAVDELQKLQQKLNLPTSSSRMEGAGTSFPILETDARASVQPAPNVNLWFNPFPPTSIEQQSAPLLCTPWFGPDLRQTPLPLPSDVNRTSSDNLAQRDTVGMMTQPLYGQSNEAVAQNVVPSQSSLKGRDERNNDCFPLQQQHQQQHAPLNFPGQAILTESTAAANNDDQYFLKWPQNM